MASESDKVHPLEDRERVDRLLSALQSHERQVVRPAQRLVLECDGETLAELESGSAEVSLRLPRRARSLTLRDENDRVRGFVMLDEADLEPCELDEGRLELRFSRDDADGLHVALRAVGGAAEDERARQPAAARAEPVSVLRVVDAQPVVDERPGWSRWLAAAGVLVVVGASSAGYLWYRSYQDTRARIAAQQAEQERQQQELARLQRAKAESDRKVAELVHHLKAANSEAERARIQAELEAERAKAAETGKRVKAIRGVGAAKASGGGEKGKAACKPGDPLCSDM